MFSFLNDPSFQGVNRFFVLLFENEGDRKVHTGYYIPKAEIIMIDVMIDGKDFYDQPIKSQGDGYTTGYLLDYPYFKEHYKLIATDLSKQ